MTRLILERQQVFMGLLANAIGLPVGRTLTRAALASAGPLKTHAVRVSLDQQVSALGPLRPR